MGGAAAVVGLFRALAARKAKVNVVGIIGLAENMPSDRSYRPSDVIGSLSGKTIEVLNTDAEGRLVLADALTYIQKKYDPKFVIDLATLTGAIMIALGHEYCGTFVNDDRLWDQMQQASKATGEKLWRMPLDDAFKNSMKGSISDVQNLSTMGRYGGACSAAGFLAHFIDDKRAWAHMDIAGTAWVSRDTPLAARHATGFGVRVLNQLIADHYEG
jgi:leucyl aminopeptidase